LIEYYFDHIEIVQKHTVEIN